MGAEKKQSRQVKGHARRAGTQILMGDYLHGYAIAQLIQQLSDDLLRVEGARSLYPALQRLELNRWITGARACRRIIGGLAFYKLTLDGRNQLAEESPAKGE
jgi:PadR family transcriptional regulator, regulatory protein PadR